MISVNIDEPDEKAKILLVANEETMIKINRVIPIHIENIKLQTIEYTPNLERAEVDFNAKFIIEGDENTLLDAYKQYALIELSNE